MKLNEEDKKAILAAIIDGNYLRRILNNSVGNANGCMIWQGSTDKDTGYGQIRITYGKYKSRIFKVHRLIAYYFHGLDLFDLGLDACHSCHTRNCVNLAHIWIGTRSENLQHSADSGRWHGGGKSGPQSVTNHLKEKDWGRWQTNSLDGRKLG